MAAQPDFSKQQKISPATGFGNINGAGGTCAISYDAKLPAQSTAIANADIMNVMFTIAWNEVSTASISTEPTTAVLTPGDVKAATISFSNADPSATSVTVTSSNENVATASVDTPVTTTSTSDSTADTSLSVFSLVDTVYAANFTGLPVSKAVEIKIKSCGTRHLYNYRHISRWYEIQYGRYRRRKAYSKY